MNALDLFTRLAALIPNAIEAEFQRRDCCILATRLAIEVASYFGIAAAPLPVRVVLLNAAFAKHVDAGEYDVAHWMEIDGSYSVGIGFGFADDRDREGRWDGHLIAATPECFGDFAIQQAERPAKGILTGPALVGPLHPGQQAWGVVYQEQGTVAQYCRFENSPPYRRSPDWTDSKRRRKLAGPIIRALQGGAW